MLRLPIATGLAVLLAAATAGAEPDDASSHLAAAEAAVAREAWADAVTEYQRAYALDANPVLLFKLGSALARAGRCTEAGATFDRYLVDGSPSPEYRALVEERRTACVPGGAAASTSPTGAGAATGTGTATGTGAGTGPQPGAFGTRPGVAPPDDPDTLPSLGGPGAPSFTDSPTTWKRSAAWISTGATVGLVAVGTVLALSAEGAEEDLSALIDFRAGENGSDRPLRWDEIDDQYQDLVDEGERFDTLATYTFAAAGVTAAAAVTFFILDATGHHEGHGVAVAPAVGRRTAAVSVGWRF